MQKAWWKGQMFHRTRTFCKLFDYMFIDTFIVYHSLTSILFIQFANTFLSYVCHITFMYPCLITHQYYYRIPPVLQVMEATTILCKTLEVISKASAVRANLV